MDDGFDLRLIVFSVLRGWWIILLAAIIGVAHGTRHLQQFQPSYVATIVVAPSAQESPNSTGLLQNIGQGLGLGVGQGTGPATPFDRLKITVGSAAFVQQLDQQYGLMRFFYSGGYDEATGTWKRPEGEAFEREERIRAALHLPTWRPPTLQLLADMISGSIIFTKMRDLPFYTITYQNPNPETAAWLLNLVYTSADEHLRRIDFDQLVERKHYLEEQLARTNNLELRTMFLSLLGNQERQIMLAAPTGDSPYTAQIVKPLFVSDRPSSPNLVRDFGVFVAGWVLGGAALARTYYLLRGAPRRR